MSIHHRIDELKQKFSSLSEWEDRYKLIIEMGKKLETLPEAGKAETFKIKGCQSQVWLYPELQADRVIFYGDSDAAIVKGIVALLIAVYSQSTPDEILATKPLFLEEMGIREHLSMSRANGLSSMLKQIQLYGLAYKARLSAR